VNGDTAWGQNRKIFRRPVPWWPIDGVGAASHEIDGAGLIGSIIVRLMIKRVFASRRALKSPRGISSKLRGLHQGDFRGVGEKTGHPITFPAAKWIVHRKNLS